MWEVPFTAVGHFYAVIARRNGIKVKRPINIENKLKQLEEIKKIAEEHYKCQRKF